MHSNNNTQIKTKKRNKTFIIVNDESFVLIRLYWFERKNQNIKENENIKYEMRKIVKISKKKLR